MFRHKRNVTKSSTSPRESIRGHVSGQKRLSIPSMDSASPQSWFLFETWLNICVLIKGDMGHLNL